MQYDASDMLQSLFKHYEMVEIGPKNSFLAYFGKVFCLRSLTPYELRPKILPNERPYYDTYLW